MNELRKEFKTFEEGLEAFLDWKRAQYHDMGGMTKEEEERLTESFKNWWNLPEFMLPSGTVF